MCLFVGFCHHVHLDPKIYIGTFVFSATRKTLLYNYYNRDFFFAENASFRSYGRCHLLASMPLTTPEPQNTDTNGIHATWA